MRNFSEKFHQNGRKRPREGCGTGFRLPFTSSRKGQYRIIFEMMLIIVGILITGYVASNFESVKESVTSTAIEDGFTSVANSIIVGLVKASQNEGTMVIVDVPDKISGHVYLIDFDFPNNALRIASLENSDVSVTRQIFNIGEDDRYVTDYQVVSSARMVKIIYDDVTCSNCIRITR